MGVRRLARSRRGFRHSRDLRGEQRGVAAVVGTLLSLLVFFALFGIFLTQYVPIWMTQNETQFSNEAQASLATLKSDVDEQYALGGPPTYAVPFTMSSEGIPLIAQPTQGSLQFLPGCPAGSPKTSCLYQSLSYVRNATSGASLSENVPTYYLKMNLPNRYYTPITYFFEDDALVSIQPGGHQLMLVPPPLNVSSTPGNVSVQSSYLILGSTSASYTAPGSKDVYTTLASHSKITSTGRFANVPGCGNPCFDVTLTFSVYGVCAWYSYLYGLMNASGIPEASYSADSASFTLTGNWSTPQAPSVPPTVAHVCRPSVSSTYVVTLVVYNVNYASSFLAQDQITFTPGGL